MALLGAMVTLLRAEDRSALEAAAYTYPEVGATGQPSRPSGYRHLERVRALPGRSLQSVAPQLMSWQLHERSGLRVAAWSASVEQAGPSRRTGNSWSAEPHDAAIPASPRP